MAQGKPVTPWGAAATFLVLMIGAMIGWLGASAAHDRHAAERGADGPAVRAGKDLAAAHANTPGFPAGRLGGDFRLVDGQGRVRTQRNPNGQSQLLFFGCATCKAICSVALPRIAEAVDRLATRGHQVNPVLITVDPERDTVAALQPALAKIHSRFVGLTGAPAELEAAYRAYQIERKIVFTHPDHGAVYAHGSYIYLLDAEGRFRTLLPPVLGPERIAEVVAGYLE